MAEVDQILRSLVSIIASYFPGRVRGQYLVGSYATGTTIATSDLDIVVVLKERLQPSEVEQIPQVRAACQQQSAISIDLKFIEETHLLETGGVKFQTHSRCLWGEDIRASVPLKPIDAHIRDSMHGQYSLFARVRGNPEHLVFPLDYPDPEGEFYGYDWRPVQLSDGTRRPSIKDLTLNVLLPAEALTLLKAGQYVGDGSKADICRQYQVWVNDQWAAFIQVIYEYCHQRWHYLVPESAIERQQLRLLCQQALGFENHFLTQYKDYILNQLPEAEPWLQDYCIQRLGRLIYRDQRVNNLLETLKSLNKSETASDVLSPQP
ncbi:MAG: nucleotidyltransferase domain-containing protein [Leptolyngbya sp. SIO1E4]|nr:nucleotidyltransferase domain-containing protein [Leptolyngbya sp. SIO1E4]